jgi:Zn-dependent M28 family amino/carboxypeptidase
MLYIRKTHFVFVTTLFILAGCTQKETIISFPGDFGKNCLKTVSNLVAFGDRHAGSAANRKQADFIADVAIKAGATVTIDRFQRLTSDGILEMQNIIAEIRGGSDEFIVIGCHYDTKKLPDSPGFQGANDGASGVALLLEMISNIKKHGIVLPYTVKFVFFDGEECLINYTAGDGLWGSKHYVETLRNSNQANKCKLVIIADMIGDAELNAVIPANTDRRWSLRALALAEKLNYSSYIRGSSVGMVDDHQPFFEAGIPVLNIIDFEYGYANSYWHTSGDTVDKLSAESFTVIGNFLLNVLYNFKIYEKS